MCVCMCLQSIKPLNPISGNKTTTTGTRASWRSRSSASLPSPRRSVVFIYILISCYRIGGPRHPLHLTTAIQEVKTRTCPPISHSTNEPIHPPDPPKNKRKNQEREESARIKHELTEGRAKERQEELKKRAVLLLEQRRVEGQLEVARFRAYWRCVGDSDFDTWFRVHGC